MSTRKSRAFIGALLASALTAAGLFVVQPEQDWHGHDAAGLGPVYETANTLTVEYQTTRFERPGFGSREAGDITEVVAESRERLRQHRGEGFRVKPVGRNEWSRPLELNAALDRFSEQLRNSPRLEVWVVRSLADGYKEKGRKVDTNPLALIATSGNDMVDLIAGTAVEKFPTIHSLGVLVCKRISESSSWSQHAYGNAVDFGGPGGWGSDQSIRVLDALVDYMDRADNALGTLAISQVGWRNWPNHYPGHVHFTAAPTRSGTPDCAR